MIVCVLVVLAMCYLPTATFAQGQAGTTDNSAGVGAAVPIGPNDSLNITVIGEPDLTSTYVVDPNGDIAMPFAGKIHVGGLTVDQATTLLEDKLGQIYTSPQVTVVRPTLGGITVNVIGEVGKQGPVQMRRDSHLNDVIQLSAPTTDADLVHIEVTSGLPGQAHSTLTYDLTTFLDAGLSSGNPSLNDGDEIYVPKRTINSVSVIGEVVKPGRYSVQPGETVFQLISDAGGLTTVADPTATYIKPEGGATDRPFNYQTAAQNPGNPQLDPILQEGDEVWVPASSPANSYALLGAVLKPGQFELHGETSLLDAIKLAGGPEDRAKLSKTQVTRMTAKGPTQINIDASDTRKAAIFYLQAGDYIYVPHGGAANQFNLLTVLGAAATLGGLLGGHF
jgi:protein involved in polysaccharide export with SLBB domain